MLAQIPESPAQVSFGDVARRHLAGLLLFLVCSGAVFGEDEFSVEEVDYGWRADVYQVSARLEMALNDQVAEALHKGVALTFVYDVELVRTRRWWINEAVVKLEQRYQLKYHALTDQYLLTNLNTGIHNSFPTLRAALAVLGNLVDLPVVDRQLLPNDGVFEGRLRARLDLNALPAPLRVLAYVRPAWWLASEWYTWKVTT